MAEVVRRGALAALLLAVTATAGCTGADSPPAPSSSVPAPITAPALDVSRYLAAPCSGVPVPVAVQLGLATSDDAHETVLVGAGEQAQCRFTSGPPLTAAAEVRFYPRARPVPLVTGPGSTVTATTVDGYPAGQWVLSTGTGGSFTSCQILVDVAPQQGVASLYNGPSGEPIETSCSKARQLVQGVIANLRR
ncbi:DUF3558 family protein [Amycolatopsis sp. cg9]|uniref:DUF3558 family protein n=1 Tax=Amycolatopsis sp. cg9 TaxID=3238801 RepID=UPI0035240D6F